MKEFILCASIDYNGTIISGRRHHDCYRILKELLGDVETPDRDKQGFLTSNNRHVSRKEAFIIARDNNQIFHNIHDGKEDVELTSEDLYYNSDIDL